MAVAIALAALVISFSTFGTTYWRDRRDLLLRVHHGLTTVDQQRGRRLAHQLLGDQHYDVSALDADQFDLINSALAEMNNMAFYYRRRYIPRKPAMEFWAEPVVKLLDASAAFLAYRDAQRNDGRQQWRELRAFADAARMHEQKRRGKDAPAAEAAHTVAPTPGQE